MIMRRDIRVGSAREGQTSCRKTQKLHQDKKSVLQKSVRKNKKSSVFAWNTTSGTWKAFSRGMAKSHPILQRSLPCSPREKLPPKWPKRFSVQLGFDAVRECILPYPSFGFRVALSKGSGLPPLPFIFSFFDLSPRMVCNLHHRESILRTKIRQPSVHRRGCSFRIDPACSHRGFDRTASLPGSQCLSWGVCPPSSRKPCASFAARKDR